MLNNADKDYITNMTMSLILNNCINRKINSMKKFENTEVEGGILNGEFIKKHLDRETELEDKIFDLEERIKNLTKISTNSGDTELYYSKDSIYYSILQGMIPYMSISLSHEDEIMKVTVDGCPIDDIMAKYLKELRFEYYSDQIKVTAANPRVYERAFDYGSIDNKAITIKASENDIITGSTYIDPIMYPINIDTCSNNA